MKHTFITGNPKKKKYIFIDLNEYTGCFELFDFEVCIMLDSNLSALM